jgi:hypothetical protein
VRQSPEHSEGEAAIPGAWNEKQTLPLLGVHMGRVSLAREHGTILMRSQIPVQEARERWNSRLRVT